MVTSCCVRNCTNRFVKGSGINFYRIPVHPKDRREKWIESIDRKRDHDRINNNETVPSTKSISTRSDHQWTPSWHHRVCGEHFITGRPRSDPKHPDYVPNRNLGNNADKECTPLKYENLKEKVEQKQKAEEEKKAKEAADILLKIQENIPKYMEKGTQTYNDVTQNVHIMKSQVRTLEKEIDIVHHLNFKLQSQVERLKEEVKFLRNVGGQQPAHIKIELDEVLKSELPSYTGDFMDTVTIHMNGEGQESSESTSKDYDLKLNSQAQELNVIVKMDDYTSERPSTNGADQTSISKFYPNLKSHLVRPDL